MFFFFLSCVNLLILNIVYIVRPATWVAHLANTSGGPKQKSQKKGNGAAHNRETSPKVAAHYWETRSHRVISSIMFTKITVYASMEAAGNVFKPETKHNSSLKKRRENLTTN